MLNSKPLRRKGVLVAFGMGLAVVLVAGYVGFFRGQPHAVTPPPSFSNRPNVSTPPPRLRPATPLSQVDPATAADEAKGVYKGPIGDFVVSPREQAAHPTCPQPYTRTKNYKTSELYSPV